MNNFPLQKPSKLEKLSQKYQEIRHRLYNHTIPQADAAHKQWLSEQALAQDDNAFYSI